MKKVQNVLSNARRGLSDFAKRLSGEPSARALMDAAGHEPSIIEQLEQRQYLFTLTVSPADPTFQADPNRPGYGTVTALFSYFLPVWFNQFPGVTAFTGQDNGIGQASSAGPGPGGTQRNRSGAYLEQRMFGAVVTLYGAVDIDPNTPGNQGTSVQILDLYGREMQNRLDIGRPSPLLGLLDLGFDIGRPAGPGGNPPAILPTRHDQVSADDVEAIADRGNLTGALANFMATQGAGLNAAVGDAVPEFNDGIGRMNLTNTDGFTSMNVTGGISARLTSVPTAGEWDAVDGATGYAFRFSDSLMGLMPQMLAAGFAWTFNGNPQPTLDGSGTGQGAVVIGSPFVRPNATRVTYYGIDTNAIGPATNIATPAQLGIDNNFTTARLADGLATPRLMGVFSNGVVPVGSVRINGTVMGSSTFAGSLGTFYAGTMLGSLAVAGDLGEMMVAGNLGFWIRSDQIGNTTNVLDVQNPTGSIITVGGTVGQVLVAGRNRASILVTGNSVSSLPRVDLTQYGERETVLGTNPAAPTPPSHQRRAQLAFLTGANFFGGAFYRNDQISGAEFVGSGITGAVISGTLGLFDPFNTEDRADTFAFAANTGQTITLDVLLNAGQGRAGALVRVLDSEGRLVAASQAIDGGPESDTINPTGNPNSNGQANQRVRFQAPTSGVYYIVITTAPDGNFGSSLQYQMTLTGQAAVTLGQIVTGGGGRGSFIQLSNGTMGRLAYAQGIVQRDGTINRAESDPNGIPLDDYFETIDVTVSITGNIYDIETGGHMGVNPQSGAPGMVLTTSGWVGDIIVGGINTRMAAAGAGGGGGTFVGQVQGNMYSFSATIGATLGSVRVAGLTALIPTATVLHRAANTVVAGGFDVQTGAANGSSGSVGRLVFGQDVRGDQFSLITANGSTLDELTVHGAFTAAQPVISMGQGSNVRFANFDAVRLTSTGGQNQDYFIPLVYGAAVNMTDDSGVTFTIAIAGGIAGANASNGVIRVIPAVGTNGVILGRIDANLINGANLVVTTTSPGALALSNINVAANFPTSQVIFTGPAEIDVLSMNVTGGISAIVNNTPGGDIVLADVGSVQNVIVTGDLGRTQTYNTSVWALTPFRGFTSQTGAPTGVVGGVITFNPANFVGLGGQNSGDRIPIAYANVPAGQATLEDVGAPFEPYVAGLIVRQFNVNLVSAGGAIGDVILESRAILNAVVANNNLVRGSNGFEGIIGSLYAGDINSVDVGDGIASVGSSPFAAAGIFATDDINLIQAGYRVRNPIMNNVVIVAGNISNGVGLALNGINLIQVLGATIDRSYITSSNLDHWWNAARYQDVIAPNGDINAVQVTNGSVLRSYFGGVNANLLQVVGGVWDATTAIFNNNIGTVRADQFRNSLTNRDPIQYQVNQIRAGQDLTLVMVNNAAVGSIVDTFISAGRNSNQIIARDIVRSNIDIRGTLNSLVAYNDIRATWISTGRLNALQANGDIRTSTIAVSGAVGTIVSLGSITDTDISSTGPDGRIALIQARNHLTGRVTSSGPITTLQAVLGDINLNVVTTDPADAHIGTIVAGRDVVLDLDMAANTNVTVIQAGRHVGRRNVDGTTTDSIDIPGNLVNLVAGGVLYSDLRVGGTINLVQFGRAVSFLPASDLVSDAQIVAAGRINAVTINGDFDGSVISNSGGIGQVYLINGSFRAGTAASRNQILARDGDIGAVVIARGHLLGDVIAQDGSILNLTVTGDAVFGNIGISPALSTALVTGVPTTERRNQLPADAVLTAGFDGPRIFAGRDINLINITGGIFESAIQAGRNINQIITGRGIDNAATAPVGGSSFIVAGDWINAMQIGQQARGTHILAGVSDLGADARPGGVGGNADTNRAGRITSVVMLGGSDSVIIGAGQVAGADGLYATADDQSAPGISTIGAVNVVGVAANTRVRTDSGTPVVSANLNAGTNSVGGQALPVAGGFASGAAAGPTAITALGTNVVIGGQAVRLVYAGPGTATFNAATNTILLNNSTVASTLQVLGGVGVTALTVPIFIFGNDDASLGNLIVNVDLSSSFLILDGNIVNATFRNFTSGSPVLVGGSITNLTVGAVGTDTTVQVEARGAITSTRLLGGMSNAAGSIIRALDLTNVVVTRDVTGVISSDRDINLVQVLGALRSPAGGFAGVRAGGTINVTALGSMLASRLTAGGNLNSVAVTGNVDQSSILAGIDLGRDAAFGGAGVNADSITNGNITAVTVGGQFIRSDISAGIYRGADNFLGTADDRNAGGRSSVGAVNIVGAALGSAFNTEQFRITSNGTVGLVRSGGLAFNQNQNLRVNTSLASPLALQATQIPVDVLGGVYTALLRFNQPIDPTTIAAALSIAEIRGAEGALTTINLVQGTDYTVVYDAVTLTARITFSAAVTSRNLVAGAPGVQASPGVYRVVLNNAVLRGQTPSTLIDGDGSGAASSGDNFSIDIVVGDAGDRAFSGQVNSGFGSNVDLYGPVNLDLLMNRNQTPAARPDINRAFTVRGTMGDHPDHNPTFFGTASDVDLYSITLAAGQIIRFTNITGAAGPAILLADGTQPGGGDLAFLPDGNSALVLTAGTYLISVTNGTNDPADNTGIVNDGEFGGIYSFDVTIVQDGDSGFRGAGDASNGDNVEAAPLPSAFAGADTLLGTPDDLVFITVGQYTYRLDAGANNIVQGNGTAAAPSDDRVIGVNQYGTEQVRTPGTDGRFGTGDDVTVVNSAIGELNPVGAVVRFQSDVDVYHLNAGAPIAANTIMRFTFRISEFGGDLSLMSPRPVGATTDGVAAGIGQPTVPMFALFDASQFATLNQANVVASPTNIEAFMGTPNTIIASDGRTTYGYDAAGDFYMQVTMPPRQDNTAQNGRFALYVQGVNASNYSIEVQTIGTGTAPVAQSQNILLEAGGGQVDWLEPYVSSLLAPYNGLTLSGVAGLGGLSVRDYVLQNVVTRLNNAFVAAGVNVTVASSATGFAGQPFSTVFLTDTPEPAFQTTLGRNGAVQRPDMLNANRTDQGIVFAPSLNVGGFTLDQAGIDNYVTSVVNAVTEQINQLLGLRVGNSQAGANFIIGGQNNATLLRRIFGV